MLAHDVIECAGDSCTARASLQDSTVRSGLLEGTEMHSFEKLSLSNRIIFNFLVASFLTYSIINSTGQFQNAYHGKDDWFLHTPQASTIYIYFALSEGRWLNYPWTLVSYHLTPELSYASFTILYGLAILILTAQLIETLIFPLVYIAFFFSPFILIQSQWSASQIPAMGVFLVTAFALYRISSPVGAAVVATLGQTASFLTYPAVAPVILLLEVLRVTDSSKLAVNLIISFVCFAIALLLAMLVMSGINFFVDGYFGLKIAEWRHPNIGTSLTAIAENATRFLDDFSNSANSWLHVLSLGGMAFAIGLLDHASRRPTIVVISSVGYIFSYEFALCLATGTLVPDRARYWLWLPPLFISAIGLTREVTRWARYAFSATILAFAAIGALTWTNLYSNVQRILKYEDALILRGKQLQSDFSREAIYLGKLGGVPELDSGFIDYAYLKHGMLIKPCSPEQCKEIDAIQSTEMVFLLGDTVVFRFPPTKN